MVIGARNSKGWPDWIHNSHFFSKIGVWQNKQGINGFTVFVVVACAATGAVLCELCDRLFYERMDYKHHFKRRHLGQFNIRCDACCKGFWKTSGLRQHTCFPEMRDENLQLQREKEEEALHQRSKVRASMGLDEGEGIHVDNVVDEQKADDIPAKLQDSVDKSRNVETPTPSACYNTVIATRLHSSRQTSSASVSQNISETTAELLAVSQNSRSNASSGSEVEALPTHGYGTRKKRISFRQLVRCS